MTYTVVDEKGNQLHTISIDEFKVGTILRFHDKTQYIVEENKQLKRIK